MGRKRATPTDLPPRVHQRGNVFYLVLSEKTERLWVPLGRDKPSAIRNADRLYRQFRRMGDRVAFREEVLKRDRFRCVYCGSVEDLELDHVIPLARGGAHSTANIVVACRTCNGSKSDRNPALFIAELMNMKRPKSA